MTQSKIKTIFYDLTRPEKIVIIIAILAICIRVLKLIKGGPVSFDEAWSHWLGSKDLGTLFQIMATDKHPPFFYLLMHFWNMFF